MFQVYYTTTPNKPLSQWESQFVDNNKLTTISDLTPHTIYTIRWASYQIKKWKRLGNFKRVTHLFYKPFTSAMILVFTNTPGLKHIQVLGRVPSQAPSK